MHEISLEETAPLYIKRWARLKSSRPPSSQWRGHLKEPGWQVSQIRKAKVGSAKHRKADRKPAALIKKETNKQNKLWHIYTMEYYGAERKKKLLPSMTVDGTGEHHAK